MGSHVFSLRRKLRPKLPNLHRLKIKSILKNPSSLEGLFFVYFNLPPIVLRIYFFMRTVVKTVSLTFLYQSIDLPAKAVLDVRRMLPYILILGSFPFRQLLS